MSKEKGRFYTIVKNNKNYVDRQREKQELLEKNLDCCPVCKSLRVSLREFPHEALQVSCDDCGYGFHNLNDICDTDEEVIEIWNNLERNT